MTVVVSLYNNIPPAPCTGEVFSSSVEEYRDVTGINPHKKSNHQREPGFLGAKNVYSMVEFS